jgi:hypothetical protein
MIHRSQVFRRIGPTLLASVGIGAIHFSWCSAGIVSVTETRSHLSSAPPGNLITRLDSDFVMRDTTISNSAGLQNGVMKTLALRDPATGNFTFVYDIPRPGWSDVELLSRGNGRPLRNPPPPIGFDPLGPSTAMVVGPIQIGMGSTVPIGASPAVRAASLFFGGAREFVISDPRETGGTLPPPTGRPPGTTVPVPPAIYTGLGVLIACGMIGMMRKSLGLVPR